MDNNEYNTMMIARIVIYCKILAIFMDLAIFCKKENSMIE
jgi:hypothetical protein